MSTTATDFNLEFLLNHREPPPSLLKVEPVIQLTDQEAKLCSVLLEATSSLNQKHEAESKPTVTMRIAGGWVRDKVCEHGTVCNLWINRSLLAAWIRLSRC